MRLDDRVNHQPNDIFSEEDENYYHSNNIRFEDQTWNSATENTWSNNGEEGMNDNTSNNVTDNDKTEEEMSDDERRLYINDDLAQFNPQILKF